MFKFQPKFLSFVDVPSALSPEYAVATTHNQNVLLSYSLIAVAVLAVVAVVAFAVMTVSNKIKGDN